jgi:hypothetical protein
MKKFPRLLVKLLPILIVASLVAFGSTSMVSTQLHLDTMAQLKQSLDLVRPVLINIGIAFVVVYSAFLAFHPLRCGVQRCLDSASNTLHARGRRFWMLFFQAAFWVTIGLLACRIVAPGFVDSAMLSSSIVMGVVGLAAQNEVKNVIASVFLHSAPKCEVGDYIKIVGSEGAEGVITKIDYLSATIDVKGEGKRSIIVPNSTVWNNSVVLGKPEAEEKKKDDDKKVVVVVRCCGGNHGADEQHGCCSQTCTHAADASDSKPTSETSDATDSASADGRGPRSAHADAEAPTESDAASDHPRGPRSARADSRD